MSSPCYTSSCEPRWPTRTAGPASGGFRPFHPFRSPLLGVPLGPGLLARGEVALEARLVDFDVLDSVKIVGQFDHRLDRAGDDLAVVRVAKVDQFLREGEELLGLFGVDRGGNRCVCHAIIVPTRRDHATPPRQAGLWGQGRIL